MTMTPLTTTSRFGLINLSKRISIDDVLHISEACDTQVKRDLAPAWNRTADPSSVFVVANTKPGTSLGISVVLLDSPSPDDAADSGVLGYHSDDKGNPYARCFVSPVLDNGGGILDGGTSGVSVASVISHEILETFVDPEASFWCDAAMNVGDKKYVQVALEVCDPVEGTLYAISTSDGKNVYVSNFVYPEWFTVSSVGQYDYCKTLKIPLTLAKNSYVIGRTGGPGTEDESFDADFPVWRRNGKSLRRMRRLIVE